MTASVLKQNPNTKRFKRTLIYFNMDTQYANFQGNPLYPCTLCVHVKINKHSFEPFCVWISEVVFCGR